jgi:prepilin-type N-terminal cleavage/methylation domain-containing protein
MNKNLRGRKGQQGFTLIELLVVVTILGILAGIVTLSLVGLTTNANAQSCMSEYKTVQAALDSYMANNNLDTLPVGTTGSFGPSHDMNGLTGVQLYNSSPTFASPSYTRNQFTQFYYTWDAHGKITAINSGTTGAAPGNCTIVK